MNVSPSQASLQSDSSARLASFDGARAEKSHPREDGGRPLRVLDPSPSPLAAALLTECRSDLPSRTVSPSSKRRRDLSG
jgi:hypothetical protein